MFEEQRQQRNVEMQLLIVGRAMFWERERERALSARKFGKHYRQKYKLTVYSKLPWYNAQCDAAEKNKNKKNREEEGGGALSSASRALKAN